MVITYHRCPIFACGSARAGLVYWWAARDGAGWRFRFAGELGLDDRPVLEAQIAAAAHLETTPAAAVAAAQDARAEAPDL
jgi:hypothetical protein